METVKITTSQNVEIDYPLASIADRILARLIDYGVFFGLYIIFAVVFVSMINSTGDITKGNRIGTIITVGAYLFLFVFYDLVCELFFNGQSVGKLAMKIKVVSIDGSRPTISQYVLRWIFRIVDFGATLGSLAVVTVALSDNKQRTGDMVAGTTLIKTEPFDRFHQLFANQPEADHAITYPQVAQLSDKDMSLVYEVIRYFNQTRNSLVIYKLAVRIKAFLGISHPPEINEYQFLQIVVRDHAALASHYEA